MNDLMKEQMDSMTAKEVETVEEAMEEALTAAGTDAAAVMALGSAAVSSDGAGCIRIGGATGIQICFGTFSFNDRGISVALNGKTTIYTGFKKDFVSFPQAFSEAPVVIAAPSMPCRDQKDVSVFRYPYWFGDAVGSTTGIANLDIYTNAKYTKADAMGIYGRYIAIGKY